MTEPSSTAAPALVMSGIDKRYGPVVVLRGVALELKRGELLALVGENGAGKSTLMRILAGAIRADAGQITVDSHLVTHPSPAVMLSLGIAVIYQEFMLAQHLTVAENVFLGRPRLNALGLVDWAEARRQTRDVMERLGFDIDPNARIDRLSVAQRQIVEIAKALTRNARIIILDEPSAVLGDAELEKLFDVIRRLKHEGVSFIYISHRLNEVAQLSDRVTVLRDGAVVMTRATKEITTHDIVRAMVGRDLEEVFPVRHRKIGDIALKVSGLNRAKALKNISFNVRSGEIVGICGLAGAGRTELLRGVIGADRVDSVAIELHGKAVTLDSPMQAIRSRIGFVPEDRKTEGLFLAHPIAFNMTIARLKKIAVAGLLRLREEFIASETLRKAFRVRTPDVKQKVGSLSGGNQQKCMIARSVFADCDVLLVDEPTRGVDVGAKRDLYQVIAEMADNQGVAILLVSSDLPEILGLSDRILVLREGAVSAELNAHEATQEIIMKHATFH